jgi:hypothetical protein
MRNQWLKALIPAVALGALPMLPAVSQAGVAFGVSITLAPPALPVYVQPPLPAPGYIWSPGYWAYGDDGYYWVPGTWVLPPQPGLLWTPGYWGWVDGAYLWHGGYWGPHVGFYGGINYGCGYTGVGFQGGYWRGGAFFYNRSVMNVGAVHVTNVYNRTVINNVTVNHVSFNGGSGGIEARPTAHELAYDHERHFQPTSLQTNHEHAAFGDRNLRASVNHGAPPVAATARPAVFSGRGVVAARASGPQGGPAHEMPRNDRPGGRGPESHGGPAPGEQVNAGGRGAAFAGAHGSAGTAGHATPMMHNDRPPGAGSGRPEVNTMARNSELHSGGGHSAPGGGGGFQRNDRPAPSMNGGGHNAPERMVGGNGFQPRPAPNMSGGSHPAPNMSGAGHPDRPAPNMSGGGFHGGAPNMSGPRSFGPSQGGGHPAMNNAPRPGPNPGGGGQGGHPQQQGHRPEGHR